MGFRPRFVTMNIVQTLPLIALAALAACAELRPAATTPPQPAEEAAARPQARPASVAPAANARTAEQFDTTTAEQRAAAAAPKAGGERSLGTSVASLGDPSKPGFWLETPLVTSPTQGRVRYPGSGKSAQVELLPIDGATTSGSRISLAAMRLIEAPLTDLPTLEVYAGG